jgi:hypothetical protein
VVHSRWAYGCPASFTFHTRHSLISVKHTIHASHLIFCLYSYFLFRLSIDLGRLVGSIPLRCQKNESLAHLSSIVAGRVVVRGGHRYYRVLSLLRFTYRIVFLYLLLVWSTFNRALFSLLRDHDQSIHTLLVIATGLSYACQDCTK